MGYPKTRCVAPTRPSGAGKTEGLSVIILGASPGYKMRAYGAKCLLKDKYGNTLLDNQSQIIKQNYENSEIILIGGFEIDKVYKNKPQFVHLIECTNYEQTNEIEEARLGIMNATFDKVLILFGDIYFNPPFIDQCSYEKSFLIADKEERMLADDVGLTVIDGYVTILSLALAKPKWCKTVFLRDKELRLFKQFVLDKHNNKLFLFEALNFIIERGGELQVKFSNASGNIVHIDNTEELKKI